MLRHPTLLVGACVAAGLTGFIAGLRLSTATASLDRRDISPQIVNRTLKADRLAVPSLVLPSEQSTNGRGPAALQPAPPAKSKLPVGCEAAISSIVESPLASIAARCLS